jgi:hypothetical protein
MFNSSARIIAALLLITASSPALAQDVRYSWFETSFVGQDVDRDGSLADIVLGQTVDVGALVSNAQGQFPTEDEFDFQNICENNYEKQ